MRGGAGLFVTFVQGGGGNIPAGAAVTTDSFNRLQFVLSDGLGAKSDTVSFRLQFPDSNAAQSDAVSFRLQFPDSNVAQTDDYAIRISAADSLAAQADVLTSLSITFSESMSAQSDAVSFRLQFPDSNAPQTDVYALSLIFQDQNAAQSDASSFIINANYADTLAAQTETVSYRLVFSDALDSKVDSGFVFVAYLASGTFVATSTSATAECWGGGKGGQNGGPLGTAAIGGEGGGYGRSVVTLIPSTSYTVNVGAGGANGNPPTNGGSSWFVNPTTVRGKGGGTADTDIGTVTYAGGLAGTPITGGNGTGGGGGAGNGGPGQNSADATAGAGGQTPGGAGGIGYTTDVSFLDLPGGAGGDAAPAGGVPGTAGTVPGGGGGGGRSNLTVGQRATGGPGAAGRVVIKWTL